MNKVDEKAGFLKNFSEPVSAALLAVGDECFNGITEIRLRRDKPLIIRSRNTDCFLAEKGVTTKELAYYPSGCDIADTFAKMCGYSPYAYEDEIRNGFITLFGGHRVGICGQAVTENGRIKTIKNISSLNIRIAREIVGASDGLMDLISNGYVRNTLIVSPPGMGKTTLLRDIIRNLSGMGLNVSVVDERSELCSCHMGTSRKNTGCRTDVLDGCPKAAGIMLLLRAMTPQVIAVDEIGSITDIEALEYIISCGVAVIATIHGRTLDDIMRKPKMGGLAPLFERFIILGTPPGSVLHVKDEKGAELWM